MIVILGEGRYDAMAIHQVATSRFGLHSQVARISYHVDDLNTFLRNLVDTLQHQRNFAKHEILVLGDNGKHNIGKYKRTTRSSRLQEPTELKISTSE